jgi:hypothetical protein
MEQRTKHHDEWITLGNSTPPTPANVPASQFVVEGHQHQSQSARDHIKWPEFVAYCASQKGRRAKDRRHVHDGLPTESGFWKWLCGQKPQWRNKVKPRDEIEGYVLDGKFFEAAAANELHASDPEKYVGRFRPAVKRNGKVQIINPP